MNLPVKYRPRRFSDVVNQEHVVRTLQNALRLGRFSHAYLFAGPRGVGKTTIARILATALNCERGPTPEPCGQCPACQAVISGSSLDVIEIDGASNRGIDEIRNLKEQIRFPPAEARFKIYIIDEVHMLTTEAFNALLKVLEEPPEYLVFMFATTDPHRIPKTVLSRVQRFDLRPLTPEDIVGRLRQVAETEGIEVEDEALQEIARYSEGSMRDALVMLEQLWVYSGGRITRRDVLNLLGVVERDYYLELLEFVKNQDPAGALRHLEDLFQRGYTPADFARGLVSFLADLMQAKLGLSSDKALSGAAAGLTKEDLVGFSQIAFELESGLGYRANPRAWAQHAVVRLCLLPRALDVERALWGSAEPGELKSSPRPAKASAQPRFKEGEGENPLKLLIETFNLEEVKEDELRRLQGGSQGEGSVG